MQYYKLFDSFSYDPRTRRAQLEILTQNKDPEFKKFIQFYDRNKSIKYELFHDVILMTDEQHNVLTDFLNSNKEIDNFHVIYNEKTKTGNRQVCRRCFNMTSVKLYMRINNREVSLQKLGESRYA